MSLEKRPKGVLFYLTDIAAMQQLTLEERGAIFTAALEYTSGAVIEVENLPGGSRFLWPLFQARLDAQIERYIETCERNRRNRNSGTTRDQS